MRGTSAAAKTDTSRTTAVRRLPPVFVLGAIVAMVGSGAVGGLVSYLVIRERLSAQTLVANPPPMSGRPEATPSEPPTEPPPAPPASPGSNAAVQTVSTPPPPAPPLPLTAVRPTVTDPTPPPDKPSRLTPEVIDRLKRSTVYLEREDGDEGGSGTGWFGLEPGLIVTNAHVVGMKLPGSKEPAKMTVFVDSGVPGKQRVFEGQKVKILAVDRDMDLAVLQIVNEADLPPPLSILPSTTLYELDRLVALGFPGGRRLAERNRSNAPPVVTLTETTVSAFRHDSAGNRYSIQIQGGVVHGNSGGPIVDPAGNVVGVAVRVDINPATGQMTNIAYAVPAEYVTGLLSGRAVEAEGGQPYTRGDEVVFPVIVRCADALKRLTKVGVACWVGDANDTPRPPGDSHRSAPGDVGYREVELTYDRERRVAVGEVAFPKLTDGRVYWVQPYYSNAVVSRWYVAGNILPNTSPPVNRQPGELRPNYTIGDESTLRVIQTTELTERTEVGGREEWRKETLGQDLRLIERVERPPTPGQHASVSHSFGSFTPVYRPFQQDTPLPPLYQEVVAGLTRWSSTLAVDHRGGVKALHPPAHPTGSDPARGEQLTRIARQVQSVTQGSFVPLPGKRLSAGESWTDDRPHRFVLQLDHLLLEHPAGRSERRGHLVHEECRFTYLGKRTRNGRSELVIQVDGVLHPVGNREAVCGVVSGTAVLNEADGMLASMDLKREFDLDTSVGGVIRKAVGTETYTVTREN